MKSLFLIILVFTVSLSATVVNGKKFFKINKNKQKYSTAYKESQLNQLEVLLNKTMKKNNNKSSNGKSFYDKAKGKNGFIIKK